MIHGLKRYYHIIPTMQYKFNNMLNIKSGKRLLKDADKLGTPSPLPTSFKKLTDQEKRFIQFYLSVCGLSRIDKGTGIIQTLTSYTAFYH